MPHQCNITLKSSQTAHIALFKYMKTRYFLVFCLLEEIYILLNGNEAILRLIVNCVIDMLLVCCD